MLSKTLRLALLGDIGHVNIQRWCESLAGTGTELVVMSFAKSPIGDWVSYQIPALQNAGKLNYFLAASQVRRLLAQVRPDVVAAYYVTGYGTLGTLTGFHPIVQVTSGSDVLAARDKPWTHFVASQNLMRADLVTAWAPHMAEAAVQIGATPDRLFVLPRGIPTRTFGSVYCRAPRYDEDCVRLISTRSLKENYRVERLVETAHLLKARGQRFSLTIAGDGPLRSKLERQIRMANLEEEVHMIGFVSNSALPAVLAGHDLYISLVPSDGVSASLLEAMCVGLFPLVAQHPSNAQWITHQQNGILLDTDDPQSVAHWIVEVAGNVGLRNNARSFNREKVVELADMERNSTAYLDRFMQLCQKSIV